MIYILLCQVTSITSEASFIISFTPKESTRDWQSSNNSWSHSRKAKTHSSVKPSTFGAEDPAGSEHLKLRLLYRSQITNHSDFEKFWSSKKKHPTSRKTHHLSALACSISPIRCILDVLHVWNIYIPTWNALKWEPHGPLGLQIYMFFLLGMVYWWIPSWELTYPPPKALLKMIFLFQVGYVKKSFEGMDISSMNRDHQHGVFDVSLEFLELQLFKWKQVHWSKQMVSSEILQVPKTQKVP